MTLTGTGSFPDGDPIALMARETAARETDVAECPAGQPFPEDGWIFGPDWFAMGVNGLRFLYRRGDGVAWQAIDETSRGYAALYLSGAVYTAVASLNGLFPLHVSAVLHKGRAYAFGGPSGAGKSTLVAALASRGFPLVADDTLLVVPGGSGAPFCLPGHKRLKLARDSFALAPAEREEVADAERDKFYARPASIAPDRLHPLAAIVFLEERSEVGLRVLSGGERLARLRDSHYTSVMFDQAQQLTPADRFALQARIARAIEVGILTRPLGAEHFAASADAAARFILTAKA